MRLSASPHPLPAALQGAEELKSIHTCPLLRAIVSQRDCANCALSEARTAPGAFSFSAAWAVSGSSTATESRTASSESRLRCAALRHAVLTALPARLYHGIDYQGRICGLEGPEGVPGKPGAQFSVIGYDATQVEPNRLSLLTPSPPRSQRRKPAVPLLGRSHARTRPDDLA